MSTTQKPSANQSKIEGDNGLARPEGADKLEENQLSTEACHVIAHKHGWTLATYKNEDGSSGAIMSNGKAAIHFDANERIIISTGDPAQGGCGGQVVINSSEKLETSKTSTIHITGNNDTEERQSTGDGKEKTKKSPAYSLMVEGDIAIEGRGEVTIGGDNITLNAKSVLSLIAGERIDLTSGAGSGKINMLAGDLNSSLLFKTDNIAGGTYTESKGEVTVNQKQSPGSTTSVNTVGAVNYVVNGNYDVSVKGNYQLSATGNILHSSSKGGFAIKIPGKYYSQIGGVKEERILGKAVSSNGTPPTTTYKLTLGTNETGLDIKSAGNVKINALSSEVNITGTKGVSLLGGIKISAKASAIYLN